MLSKALAETKFKACKFNIKYLFLNSRENLEKRLREKS